MAEIQSRPASPTCARAWRSDGSASCQRPTLRGCAARGTGHEVGGGNEQQDRAQWPQGSDREVEAGRDDPTSEDEGHARAGDQTEPEGDAVEGEDGRDLDRRQAPNRVEAEAHRRAAEEGEPDVLGERETEVGGEGRALEPDLCSDIAQRDGVVLGQHQIAERGGRNRRQEGSSLECSELVDHLVQPDQLELAMEDVERDSEQDDSDDRRQPVQPTPRGGVLCHVPLAV